LDGGQAEKASGWLEALAGGFVRARALLLLAVASALLLVALAGSAQAALTASFEANPNPAKANNPVNFTAKTSGGTIKEYVWNFGVGGPPHVETVPTAAFDYTAPGVYTVTLTVRDTEGHSAKAENVVVRVHGVPTVNGELVSSLGSSTATLSASVDPNGSLVSECWFEYGTSLKYGHSVPCAPSPGAGEAPVGVSASLGGLSEIKTYHFRVVARNEEGKTEGIDNLFTTATAVSMPLPTPTAGSPIATGPGSSGVSGEFAPPKVSVNRSTGALTITVALPRAGTFSWLLTFANGQFGAFASSARCSKGTIRLGGRCLPARITFAKGHAARGAAGTLKVTLRPSPSARRALRNAQRRHKALRVTALFTFAPTGGAPVSRSRTLPVALRSR
jgi:PKD domain